MPALNDALLMAASRYRKAKDAVELLKQNIAHMTVRMERASRRSKMSSSYLLLQRISVYEGVCGMYEEYALRMAREVEKLENEEWEALTAEIEELFMADIHNEIEGALN